MRCSACGIAGVELTPLVGSAFCPSCTEMVRDFGAYLMGQGDDDPLILEKISRRFSWRAPDSESTIVRPTTEPTKGTCT